MEVRHASSPRDAKHYTTDRLRQDFLMQEVMVPGKIRSVYTHHDRMTAGGAVPVERALELEASDILKTDFFLERRELGIINIGGPGRVTVEGQAYALEQQDCLYVGMGKRKVLFESDNKISPAKFYLVSAPAHQTYPTQKLALSDATPNHLGDLSQSNERTIYQYIHADGIQSCQLMMGMTLLKPNNMWNTMPAHLHDRRSEIYFYFNMTADTRVFHFMGEPDETRHLVVQNEEIVISPSWSIHSGIGTSNYTFIWAMAGENYTFKDMDVVPMHHVK